MCTGGRGPNYYEVDIDVGSSKSAASVVGLVQGALKGLVIDMAITLEGHTKVTCLHTHMQCGWLGFTYLCACLLYGLSAWCVFA